jgi:PAS domain S-box-containing protein
MTILDISEIILAVVAVAGSYLAAIKVYNKKVKPIMELAEKINVIYMEVKPNHGSSIKDAISRIEMRQLTFEQKMKAVQMDYEHGVFEANAGGECVYANRTYSYLTGRSLDECKGNGWILALHPLDRDNVVREWELAVSQQREFSMQYRFVKGSEVIPVKVSAFPIFDLVGGDVFGFTGIVTRLLV